MIEVTTVIVAGVVGTLRRRLLVVAADAGSRRGAVGAAAMMAVVLLAVAVVGGAQGLRGEGQEGLTIAPRHLLLQATPVSNLSLALLPLQVQTPVIMGVAAGLG